MRAPASPYNVNLNQFLLRRHNRIKHLKLLRVLSPNLHPDARAAGAKSFRLPPGLGKRVAIIDYETLSMSKTVVDRQPYKKLGSFNHIKPPLGQPIGAKYVPGNAI